MDVDKVTSQRSDIISELEVYDLSWNTEEVAVRFVNSLSSVEATAEKK